MSSKSEKAVAKKLRLKRHQQSGARYWAKHDMSNNKFLAELKETDGRSISIKLDDLKELKRNAVLRNKIPLFVFRVLDEIWIAHSLEDAKQIKISR